MSKHHNQKRNNNKNWNTKAAIFLFFYQDLFCCFLAFLCSEYEQSQDPQNTENKCSEKTLEYKKYLYFG